MKGSLVKGGYCGQMTSSCLTILILSIRHGDQGPVEGERARGGPEQPEGRHPEVRAAVLRLQPGGQPGVPPLPAGGAARGRQQGRHQARTHQHRDRQQLKVSQFLHPENYFRVVLNLGEISVFPLFSSIQTFQIKIISCH